MLLQSCEERRPLSFILQLSKLRLEGGEGLAQYRTSASACGAGARVRVVRVQVHLRSCAINLPGFLNVFQANMSVPT